MEPEPKRPAPITDLERHRLWQQRLNRIETLARDLPLGSEPPDIWPQLEARAASRRPRQLPLALRLLPYAAALAIALGGVVQFWMDRPQSEPAEWRSPPETAEAKAQRWLRLLRHPQAEIRAEAARALGDLGAGARSALPELEKLLADPDEKVRAAAQEARKRIQAP